MNECSVCHRRLDKDNLRKKRVQFLDMDGKVVRTRTVAFLCLPNQEDGTKGCLYLDEDWNRPMYSASPGYAGITGA